MAVQRFDRTGRLQTARFELDNRDNHVDRRYDHIKSASPHKRGSRNKPTLLSELGLIREAIGIGA